MNPDFLHVLLTLPGAFGHWCQLAWLWSSITRPGTTLGIGTGGGGFFGSGAKDQRSVTTSYQDAFNESTSNITSSGDAGNVSLNLGEGAGGGGALLDGLLPVLLAALFLFGGLYLVTRKS